MTQYNSSMKISHIKKDMRVNLMKEIQEFLQNKHGADNCLQVSANELGVVVGSYDDKGFINDTTCVIKVSAKPFYFKSDTPSSRVIEAYDLQGEADNFKNGVEP